MSRRGDPRGSDPNLAYGDSPQRWDRDRFENFGRGPPPAPLPRRFEEDYRFTERDRPGRQDVTVQDRIQTRGPGGRFEERDRFFEEDRRDPARPRRRTDKELFGDMDPREVAEMALTPYKRNDTSKMEMDVVEQRGAARPPRPGLLRRQSSLDTFDRRPVPRYEREEYRIPTYTPVPLPIRRQDRWGEEDNSEKVRIRDYEPEDYREIEIQRERSVHRRRPKSEKSVKSSKAKSVTTTKSSRTKEPSSSSSSSESFEEVEEESVHGSVHPSTGRGSIREKSIHERIHESIHESDYGGSASIAESIQQTEKKFKKGKTKMPKRLVRREAIMDLGYPFYEEDAFFFLTIALEKEQIDEVMRISEIYKSGGELRQMS